MNSIVIALKYIHCKNGNQINKNEQLDLISRQTQTQWPPSLSPPPPPTRYKIYQDKDGLVF